MKRAWDEARAAVVGAGTEVVWLWGLGPEPDWETIITEPGTGIAETGVVECIRLLEVRVYIRLCVLAPALTAVRDSHCAPRPSMACDRVDPLGGVYVRRCLRGHTAASWGRPPHAGCHGVASGAGDAADAVHEGHRRRAQDAVQARDIRRGGTAG